ncbi:metallophosphoesterase [Ktedonospora formicarum]|uniref:Calcineurin-like phosphoesterase domain-containing protein n=1 Tax=Ktedonospora formicarum TaxID=2778364 RepID=A0A8J3I352_9CHLR|nr:metallophosphoesterase [Ktedonospora formicarum]GHO45153.1 hypothetical protein KSX_33160 [Ktedonospora formicarum]
MSKEQYLHEINAAFGGWEAEDYSIRQKIHETRILVASDAHLPYGDRKLLAKMRETIHRFNIQCVLWLGDLFDMHKFSGYGQTDYSLTWIQEKEIASNIILQIAADLRQTGGYQVISRGNHDYRWIKKLGDHERMTGLVSSISPDLGILIKEGDIVVSDNPTLEGVPDKNGSMTWVFTHPAQFKAPFGTPTAMALMEQKNVMTGHAHHLGVTRDASNKFWCVEAGGLFQDKSFEYVQRNPSTMRRMVSGFWVILDPYTMPMGFTSHSETYIGSEVVEDER